jgi:tRNA(Ile)-lysidine synthase
MSTSNLSKDSFLSELKPFSSTKKFWVACSGGLDSCVLLHLFYSFKNNIKQTIEVVYVNHGLQEESEKWGQFCKELCQQYELVFTEIVINEKCPKGKSIEEWAREKRYSLIVNMMKKNDVLFTAHHQDDQVETFFLQAFRGAGPRGLSSMPSIKSHDHIFLCRPLLDFTRAEIEGYAKENNLTWQVDSSNSDIRYDRNFLRQKVLPVIEERWPSYRKTINRLILNQQEFRSLIDDVACGDMKLVSHKDTMCLNVKALKQLSIERQKNLICFWLSEQGFSLPGSKNVIQILSDIVDSREDKSPCVDWKSVEIRRYKNLLYALEKIEGKKLNVELEWSPEDTLSILNETLIAKSQDGKGISKSKTKDARFIIRYRQGGEKINPDKHGHTKTVKQLFQENAVLPWLRDQIPLIYIDEKLAVIPGFCIDNKYAAEENEPSWNIEWSGYNKVIQQ